MQEILIPAEMPVEARRQILRDHADSLEDTKYQKPLSTDVLDVKRELLTDNAILLSQYDDELTQIRKDFKVKMEPLRRENKELLAQIKTRQETVEGRLYHLANHTTGFMETYDDDGVLVSTRRLRPDEKQAQIFSIPKQATN